MSTQAYTFSVPAHSYTPGTDDYSLQFWSILAHFEDRTRNVEFSFNYCTYTDLESVARRRWPDAIHYVASLAYVYDGRTGAFVTKV